MAGLATVVEDVTLDDLQGDPYPIYARWRKESPVARFEPMGGWMVSRWDDCDHIGKLEDATDSHNAFQDSYFGPNILSMTGDPHKFLRAAVDVPLSPKAVRRYVEDLVRPIARDYVAQISERGSADATTELLELISVRAIGNVLGVADLDDDTLQRWFIDLSLGLSNLTGDAAVTTLADTAKGEIREWAEQALPRYSAQPDGSVMSNMVTMNTPDGAPRTVDELIGTIWVTILGGFQEPGHAAAASLLGLLTEPEQARAAAEDFSLLPAAVHEGLRWIAPFGTAQRHALRDIEVGGVTIPEGDEIQLVLASANRDESRYRDPDRFDVFRERLPVASFGYGPHFCAGHFLARELEKITLEEIFSGLPNLRLDPDRPATVTGFDVRGVKHLPVVWDAP